MTSLNPKTSQPTYQKWRSNLSRSAVVILSAISCQCSLAKPQLNLTPVVNPHSRHFVHLLGSVSPKIQPFFNIKASAFYLTENPACETYSNIFTKFEGAPNDQTKTIQYSISISKTGHFNRKIPVNHYQSGVCRWKLGAIAYTFSYKKFHVPANYWTSIDFSQKMKKTNITTLNSIWNCGESQCQISSYKGINESLSANKNYTLNLTFKGA